MEASSVRKIYVSSRRKTPSSNSSSDFEFELNRAITLPRKCVAFVSDIHLPHSWYNEDEHAQFLYVQESSNAYSPVLAEVFRDGMRKNELRATTPGQVWRAPWRRSCARAPSTQGETPTTCSTPARQGRSKSARRTIWTSLTTSRLVLRRVRFGKCTTTPLLITTKL